LGGIVLFQRRADVRGEFDRRSVCVFRGERANPVSYEARATLVHQPGADERHVAGAFSADAIHERRSERIAWGDDARTDQAGVAARRFLVEGAPIAGRFRSLGTSVRPAPAVAVTTGTVDAARSVGALVEWFAGIGD
jgi:hypothetical protein